MRIKNYDYVFITIQYVIDFKIFYTDFLLQASYYYFAHLSTQVVMSTHAYQKRQQLLAMAENIENFEANDSLIYCALAGYSHCTYALGPEKNNIKKQINRLITRWLIDHNISLNQVINTGERQKPVLVVMLEQFRSHHAMFRSFSLHIKALAKKFTVIGFCSQGFIDEPAKALFSELREVSLEGNLENIPAIIQQVRSFKPDVIYYPSIGLADYTIILANIRLAPIQLMGPGHPATSHANHIDYLHIEACSYRPGLEELYSERLLVTPDTFNNIPPQTAKPYQANIEKDPQVIKLAIPARSYKLSAPFMNVLLELQRTASKPIELHFFPNERGLRYECTKASILRLFNYATNVFVYPAVEYDTYCNVLLNRCHIYLSTFPFCGTNSTFDGLQLGLPPVVMENEITLEAVHDANLLRFLKLPEWLIAKNEVEYLQVIQRLIQNDEERVAVATQCQTTVTKHVAEHLNQQKESYFGDMIYALYQAHEKIKTRKDPISYEDLLGLQAEVTETTLS